MNEHELSEQLRSVAATVNPRPDLAEIELGAGRVRSRRRVATGVVAAMLVAGAGGAGFGIGRSVSDSGDQIAAGATVTDNQPSPVGSSPDDSSSDVVPAPAPTTTTPSDSGAATRPVATVDEAAADGSFIDYPADDFGYYYQEPLTVVYERLLDNGVRVRLQQGQSWGGEEWYGSDWRPAAFCWPTAEGRITIDGPDVVDVSGNGWYEELFKGLAVQPIDAGHADGHPMRLLQVQAAPDVTEVAVTWPDGATDRTAPVNGAAVLVVDGLGAYDGYTLEITDADGTRTATDRDLDYYSDPDYRASCDEPPPALPDAGEQPADRAAAEAALLERFQILWDRTLAEDAKPDDLLDDLLDDRTGVDDAIAQVLEGGFADSAESAIHTVEELVFTSPTEAWFRYGIDTSNGYFGQRYGTATLTDGVWVFPRALVCQDLGLAGAGCEPWVEAIYPPSWYERYGDPYNECWISETGEEICEFSGDGPFPPPTTIVVEG